MDSPLDNCIVDACGSIPARIPRYRTSEWEIKEIGFLCETKGTKEDCVNLSMDIGNSVVLCGIFATKAEGF